MEKEEENERKKAQNKKDVEARRKRTIRIKLT
jgi:hypothetical protein